MTDLNHILLFIAIVSPLILLARIARQWDRRNRGWLFAAITVLVATAATALLLPAVAGYIGGTLWLLLLVIPSMTDRKMDELFLTQRFGVARRLALLRHVLHPWADSPHQAGLYRALEFARAGRLDLALDGLAQKRGEDTPTGRFAAALTFALTENWSGLLQWFRRTSPVTTSAGAFSLYLRALGETGELDELVRQLGARGDKTETSPRMPVAWRVNLAMTLAFCGRTEAFVQLTEADNRLMLPESREFWRATAEWVEGKEQRARKRLDKLSTETMDAVLRRGIAHRLSAAPKPAHVSPTSIMLLDRLAADVPGEHGAAMGIEWSRTRSVWTLLILNTVSFGMELLRGDSSLENLGALTPGLVMVSHEYWRLLSAMFLHYGLLHLAVNLFALYILGPPLEQLIGSIRFLAGYLLSGIGAGLGVVLVAKLRGTEWIPVVGASGAIMGVIGISAGLLLRHRQTTLAGRQLRNIFVIVAIQTAFDLSTPQVSLAAHLSGFLSGVVVGLIFASFDRPDTAF